MIMIMVICFVTAGHWGCKQPARNVRGEKIDLGALMTARCRTVNVNKEMERTCVIPTWCVNQVGSLPHSLLSFRLVTFHSFKSFFFSQRKRFKSAELWPSPLMLLNKRRKKWFRNFFYFFGIRQIELNWNRWTSSVEFNIFFFFGREEFVFARFTHLPAVGIDGNIVYVDTGEKLFFSFSHKNIFPDEILIENKRRWTALCEKEKETTTRCGILRWVTSRRSSHVTQRFVKGAEPVPPFRIEGVAELEIHRVHCRGEVMGWRGMGGWGGWNDAI